MYKVNVHDRAGEFTSRGVSDFAAAKALLVRWAAYYPGKIVSIVNLDRVDIGDPDGLTEEEQAEVYELLAAIDRSRSATVRR